MKDNIKNIYKTVSKGNKEQKLNKQMVEFRISIFFQYFQYSLGTLILS